MTRAALGRTGGWACDIGAGTGNLTEMLVERGASVVAVEPNDAMRRIGMRRPSLESVGWCDEQGEATGLPAAVFDLVTFGSSFNVMDRVQALRESARLLRSGGWFACLWNHRDLRDPLQHGIEALIAEAIPDYRYGARREDQTTLIEDSGYFREVRRVECVATHRVCTADWLTAWRSHVTLRRQAGPRWPVVLDAIDEFVHGRAGEYVEVRYTTRLWMAQRPCLA